MVRLRSSSETWSWDDFTLDVKWFLVYLLQGSHTAMRQCSPRRPGHALLRRTRCRERARPSMVAVTPTQRPGQDRRGAARLAGRRLRLSKQCVHGRAPGGQQLGSLRRERGVRCRAAGARAARVAGLCERRVRRAQLGAAGQPRGRAAQRLARARHRLRSGAAARSYGAAACTASALLWHVAFTDPNALPRRACSDMH